MPVHPGPDVVTVTANWQTFTYSVFVSEKAFPELYIPKLAPSKIAISELLLDQEQHIGKTVLLDGQVVNSTTKKIDKTHEVILITCANGDSNSTQYFYAEISADAEVPANGTSISVIGTLQKYSFYTPRNGERHDVPYLSKAHIE